MTRPPDGGSGQPPGQPWWQRPGGAPQPGGPATPPPQRPQYPPQRPQYPAPQRPQYPPRPQQPPPHYPPQQQPGWPPAARPTPQWTPAETPAQQYGQQPAAPQPPPPAKPRQSRLPMIAGAVAAVVVIGGAALIGGLWISGFLGGGTVLDVGAAEAGVTEILSNPINGYGANDVSAVKCNGGKNPKVEVGAGFSCDVTIKGAKRTVQVVFQDDLGTYEVDGPR